MRADAPPFFVIHGDKDVLAPVVDARDFVQRLRAVSTAPVFYLELEGTQHAFETFETVRSRAVIRGVRRFLEAQLHERRTGASVAPEPQLAPA
mgnify:FL=1